MAKFSYLHIPFCTKKCKYCAFTSFVNLGAMDEYIEKLSFEIDNLYDKTLQEGLYIGGGTPSLLNIEQLDILVKKFSCDGEITIEINPENASKKYLKGLCDIGINRVSIGIQSFNDNILKIAGRSHNAKEGILAVENAREAGFSNISIDLIYGLPGETIKSWTKTLKIAKSLDIKHISAYGLKIEEKTYFDKFPPKDIPDEDKQADMYYKTLEILSEFNHYEISNFAKSDSFISKHNLNYWKQGEYNGFGISACGFKNNVRYKKTSDMKKYFINPLQIEEKTILDNSQKLEEAIFLNFRLSCGINLDEINKKFEIDFEKKYEKILDKYLKSRHIIKTKTGYKLSVEGILISNYILCDFLC